MAKLIRLTAAQNDSIQLSGDDCPLFLGVDGWDQELIEATAAKVMAGEADPGDLTLTLLGYLKYVLGRYLAHYPSCEPMMDDMIGEGVLAISRFSNEISVDILKGRGILDVVFMRIRVAVDQHLHKLRGIGPCLTYMVKDDEGELDYLESGEEYPEEAEPADEDDVFKRDMYDALEQIEARDKIDAHILCPDYWDLNDNKLAEMLGVSRQTITYRKSVLYQEYLRLTK